MKKLKFIYFLIIISILLDSCSHYMEFTPEEYKYKQGGNSREVITKDSLMLLQNFNVMLSKSIPPFNPSSAFSKSNTFIQIDSVIYNPDKTGMVVFIITQTKRNSIGKDSTNKVVYDANYLYVKKDTVYPYMKLYDYSSINFINFSTYAEVKKALMEYCFGRRATEHPYDTGEPRYNIDDTRFWNGQQFRKIYSDTSFIKL
jgi:hypothetical protein